MRKAVFICSLSLVASANAESEQDASNPLVGAWELVSFEIAPEAGDIVSVFGEQPLGLFVFSQGGYASFTVGADPSSGVSQNEDIGIGACQPWWHCAYFGSYTVNENASAWTVNVIGANIPGYAGTEQTREFQIVDTQLILNQEYIADGVNYTTRVILERVAANSVN